MKNIIGRNMDIALNAILSSSSCIDLIKALETSIHDVKLNTVNINIDLDNLLKYMFAEFRQEREPSGSIPQSISDHILIVLAVISILLDSVYIHRFALRFSKLHKSKILDMLDDESITRYINILGIKLEYSRDKCFKEVFTGISRNDVAVSLCYRYRLPINVYLRIAKKLLTEHSWSLSALVLDKGYVYIENKEKISRLFSEHLYNLISTKLINIKDLCSDRNRLRDRLITILQELYPDLAIATINRFLDNVVQDKKQTIEVLPSTRSIELANEIGKIDSLDNLIAISQTLFPSCIRQLVNSILKGENLSHHQRFALATFLINIGVDIDTIVRLFSSSPDFNEKIARYQIEHLAGLRGSKKKYLVYSCNTMKMLGICDSDCGVKNPLLYLRKLGRTRHIE